MATSEKQFQTEILRELKDNKAHAFKAWSAYGSGFVDLYAHAPGYPACWIELKFLKRKNETGSYPINMTPQQRRFLRDEQRVGGLAGWALCVRIEGTGVHLIFAGASHTATKTSALNFIHRRDRGDNWRATEIIHKIKTDIYNK